MPTLPNFFSPVTPIGQALANLAGIAMSGPSDADIAAKMEPALLDRQKREGRQSLADMIGQYGKPGWDSRAAAAAGIAGDVDPRSAAGYTQFEASDLFGARDPRTINATMGVPGANYADTATGFDTNQSNTMQRNTDDNAAAMQREVYSQGAETGRYKLGLAHSDQAGNDKINKDLTAYQNAWLTFHPGDTAGAQAYALQQISPHPMNGAGAKPTEQQSRVGGLMVTAKAALDKLDGMEGALTSLKDNAMESPGTLPLVGKSIQGVTRLGESQQYRAAMQAGVQFARAYLYSVSGANAPEEEVQGTLRTFLPQPGDGPAVIAQKRAARRTAYQAMQAMAGQAPAPQPTQAKTGDPLVDKYLGH